MKNKFLNDLKLEIYEKFSNNWQMHNEYLNMELLPIIKEKTIPRQGISNDTELNIQLSNIINVLPKKCYLAGGSAVYLYGAGRRKDYDLFIVAKSIKKYKKKLEELKKIILICVDKYQIIETIYSYSIKIDNFSIQIIKKLYKNISEILSNFDLSCSKIAYRNCRFYYTPDFAYAFKTKTVGTNFKKNSRSYMNRLGKYQHYFKIDYTDVEPTNDGNMTAIVDIINGIVCHIGVEFIMRNGDNSFYSIKNRNNLTAIVKNDIRYLSIVDDKFPIREDPDIIKNFIANLYPESKFNKLINQPLYSEYLNKFDKYIKTNEDNWKNYIKNYINTESISCFSFGNRKNLICPDEYYGAHKGIPHLNLPVSIHLKYINETLFILAWSLKKYKLNKYLIKKIFLSLF